MLLIHRVRGEKKAESFLKVREVTRKRMPLAFYVYFPLLVPQHTRGTGLDGAKLLGPDGVQSSVLCCLLFLTDSCPRHFLTVPDELICSYVCECVIESKR